MSKYDICIVGGGGHVGLPLGLSFADKGMNVCLYDNSKERMEIIGKGTMPFIEYESEPILEKVLKNKKLVVSSDINSVSEARYVVIAIGTPVDEYLNPKTRDFLNLFSQLKKYLNKDQIIIIRSTVYPHTCQQMIRILGEGEGWHIAYCPERIVQGYAIKELRELPQIIAGMTEKALEKAVELFSNISPKIIKTSIEEAELVKLFSNAWRYIQFAATNQFYMIAHKYGVNYDKVRNAMMEGYGRTATLPSAGFAAGPCLLKDTMQLAAFHDNNFQLGHAAMMINEGLPGFIVEDLRRRYDFSKINIGILGMAFKADIDDIRDSLSFKLGKILRFYGTNVYYSDEYAKNATFISKEELIKLSDVIIVGVPHSQYRGLAIPAEKEVVDLWGIIKN
ncbi:MAG: nucleotide sugar dehydrogenase [Candidatus Saganbacteria bacterium]|uniref:Nucleotide sugar dehydrogenase n=1 Tax=Candidatus Saganbacteria bacterium TaxID=2575572 RepID=A0A833L2B4_UNCSA|nr:MAG: nucleotide sugar dehydrogenase [Candidatus Saganbacteria bacterium]